MLKLGLPPNSYKAGDPHPSQPEATPKQFVGNKCISPHHTHCILTPQANYAALIYVTGKLRAHITREMENAGEQVQL